MSYYNDPPTHRIQEHTQQVSKSNGQISIKRKHSITPDCGREERGSDGFYKSKMNSMFSEHQLDDTSTIKQDHRQSHGHKYQRLRYQLINDQPPTNRSPSPQYNPVLVAEGENYQVYEDEYHVYLHETNPPKELEHGFSSSSEYCKYCDSEHDVRGCEILNGVESERSSDFNVCGSDEEEVHIKQKDTGVAWDRAQASSVYYPDTSTWSTQILQQQQSFSKFEDFTFQQDPPLYESRGETPEIQAPKPVRLSPETVENRLLVNHCKICGARCCESNVKSDCRILYEGEEYQVCHHQGCLDWADLLAERGISSGERGEGGWIDGLVRCPICGRQGCDNLITPECSRKYRYQQCTECGGIEADLDEGKHMVSGGCGHENCVSCQYARGMLAADVERFPSTECGGTGVCVHMKTMEEWEEFYYNDEEVRNERYCKEYVWGLAARVGY